MILLNAVTADGDGATELVVNTQKATKVVLWAEGTFGGGTVSLKVRYGGMTGFVALPSASLTADGAVTVDVVGPCRIIGSLSGATTPNVTAGAEVG